MTMYDPDNPQHLEFLERHREAMEDRPREHHKADRIARLGKFVFRKPHKPTRTNFR